MINQDQSNIVTQKVYANLVSELSSYPSNFTTLNKNKNFPNLLFVSNRSTIQSPPINSNFHKIKSYIISNSFNDVELRRWIGVQYSTNNSFKMRFADAAGPSNGPQNTITDTICVTNTPSFTDDLYTIFFQLHLFQNLLSQPDSQPGVQRRHTEENSGLHQYVQPRHADKSLPIYIVLEKLACQKWLCLR